MERSNTCQGMSSVEDPITLAAILIRSVGHSHYNKSLLKAAAGSVHIILLSSHKGSSLYYANDFPLFLLYS